MINLINQHMDELSPISLSIPNSILEKAISDQICNKEINLNNNDYIKIFELKKDSKINMDEADGEFEYDDIAADEWDEYSYSFYEKLSLLFKDHIGLTISAEGDDMYKTYMYALYTFFVLRLTEVIINYVVLTIKNNKNHFSEKYGSKLNNIAIRSFKKRFENKNDVIIALSIHDIIEEIISQDVLDFNNLIELLVNEYEGDYNYLQIYSLYNNCVLLVDNILFTKYIHQIYYDNKYNYSQLKNYIIDIILNSFELKQNINKEENNG